MARYDEDLHENLFFQTLIGKYSSLFKEAAEQKWLVCVPRCDAVFRLKLDRKDFENHILKPFKPESVENNFISLNNKHAVIGGDIITAGMGYKEPRSVKILFDESFFNSREESYQVFCLEQPMEGAMGDDIMISLKNLDECNKFLWGEPGGEKVRRSVDRLIEIFTVDRGTALRALMDTTLAVYTRAVQEVFKIRKFQAAMQKNFCKLAVETYIMAGLHKKIFKEVCFTVATKDAALNKITRNLSDSSPQSLGIKSQFRLLLPKARAILSQLNQFTTPLEKLYCFSHTVSTLTTGSLDATQEAVTADELLPILVYLVIVTDVPNWNGNLTYINRFHFSNISFEEFTYYMTSFEAAVEYVRSDHVKQSTKVPLSHISHADVQRLRTNSGADEDTTQFFSLVSEGNVELVRRMLEKAELEKTSLQSRLCHPLCDCTKCTALLDKQLDDSDRASVYLRDQNGRTGLHHAALLGHNELVQILMEHGAIVMATDHNSSTPLHLACLKGHQKCTLLLLGEGSSINAVDNHGNTPLHQACSNGHEECVKSLLFHTTQCEVNLSNDQGDTPLHIAARWGYGAIVSELLSMGASPHLQNKRRETAYQCAQSRKVQELLSDAQMNHTRKQASEIDGGVAMGVVEDGESPVVIRANKRMSKRLSMRESMSEVDRQLKKLFRAIQDGDTNLVRYIFGWEESNSPMVSPSDLCHPLCQCDRCSKLRKSLSTSTLSVNCTDHFGHTPLHKACLVGEREMVELFLRHGALLDSRTKDNDQTPLHLACQYNQKDVVLRLLEYRAQIDVQDALGNAPLHLACSNGHMETTALLLIHGADVTICNNRLDTPLHNAARWNHPFLVNELLLYGARYTATNNDNKTPMELTSDDQVKELIWKATKGIIAVGSYSPLVRRHSSPFSRGGKKTSPLSVSVSADIRNGGVKGRGLETAEEGTTPPVVVELPEGGISQLQVREQRDSHERSPESFERELDVSEYDMIEDDVLEHRRLGNQQEVVESKGQTSGGSVVAGLDKVRPVKEEGDLQPKGEEGQENLGVVKRVKGEELEVKSRPEEVDSHSKGDGKLVSLLKAIEDFDRSTLNRRRGTIDKSAPWLPPPEDTPTYLSPLSVLRDQSPPEDTPPYLTPPSVLPPPEDTPPYVTPPSTPPDTPPGQVPPDTPPYSPHNSYYPPPMDEEMQTVGLRVGRRDQEVATPTGLED